MVTDKVNDKNFSITTTRTTITTKTTRSRSMAEQELLLSAVLTLATLSPLEVVNVVIVVVCNREKESGGRKKICVICAICVTKNILAIGLQCSNLVCRETRVFRYGIYWQMVILHLPSMIDF